MGVAQGCVLYVLGEIGGHRISPEWVGNVIGYRAHKIGCMGCDCQCKINHRLDFAIWLAYIV